MSNLNYTLFKAIRKYMESRQWSIIKENPGRYVVYSCSAFNDEVVLLPDEDLVGHKQSESILSEAVEVIARVEDVYSSEMRRMLLDSDFDRISLRESGSAIKHGSIDLKSGMQVINNVYELFKFAAKSAVSIRGKKKITNGYLDSLRLAAPSSGSFIFNFDAYLYQPEGNDLPILNTAAVGSIGRMINISFANRLQKIRSVLDSNQNELKSNLLGNGITSKYCLDLYSVFASDASLIEFDFVWSFVEPIDECAHKKVVFSIEDRNKVREYSRILTSHVSRKLVQLPAFVEACLRKEGDVEGRVIFRFTHDKKEFSTSVAAGADLYKKLNDCHVSNEKVYVSGNLFYTEATRTKVEAFEVTRIDFSSEVSVGLF